MRVAVEVRNEVGGESVDEGFGVDGGAAMVEVCLSCC